MKIYEPNYTQVPNSVISLMPVLKESELKVLLAIVRKTLGWQKSRDRISLSQLEEMTGLKRPTVSRAIHSENLKGVVKIHKSKKGNEFEMIIHSNNFEPSNGKVVTNCNQASNNFEPVASNNFEPTKKTVKETIQKKEPTLYEIPTLKDIKECFREQGKIPENDIELEAEKFINHYEEMEWRTNKGRGKRIKNWRRQAGTWQANYQQWNRGKIQDESDMFDNHPLRSYAN